MRTLKILIGILLVLSLGILIGVGYVWKQLAFTQGDAARQAMPFVENASGTQPLIQERVNVQSTSTPLLTKPITVSTESLPESQQKVLDTLGIGAQSVTVTPQAVACAVETLGVARALEIKEGSTPSIAEGLTLLTCLKR
jgi:hypothetical protein